MRSSFRTLWPVAMAVVSLAALPSVAATNSPPLAGVTFVALDTETTGLSATKGRVLEIGAVKFRGGEVIARQSWLLNPGVPIPAEAQKINGITPQMVTNCPPFARVFPDFTNFIGDSVLLVQNAPFDRRFLAAEIERNRLTAPSNAILDTLPLCRAWFPGAKRRNLEYLAHYLAIPEAGPPATNAPAERRFHSALWDAECLMKIFLRGATNLPPEAKLEDLKQAAGGPLLFRGFKGKRAKDDGND